ncbi:UPF0715 family protein [Bacillus massiliglaciei]|uniref:UPF0715 family protein n=1 Tax=Bacillus massiliglaciei TaxID=1816693 RepID=UPI000DA63704|nr:UPF0715 family protein [Bacillus massiliglaciei]
MNADKLSESLSKLSDVIPYYFGCLVLSCVSFSISLAVSVGLLSFGMIIVYSFYTVIPYLVFAVPLQVLFNKRPRRFHIGYLLAYTILSIAAVFLVEALIFKEETTLFVSPDFYSVSFAAAVIYWFWDSVFLQRKYHFS